VGANIVNGTKNNFPGKLLKKLEEQIQHKKSYWNLNIDDNGNNKKWATFTYYSPKVRKITNLFKHANIRIAFKSNNASRKTKNPY